MSETTWISHVEHALKLIELGDPAEAVEEIKLATQHAPASMAPMLGCWRRSVQSAIPLRLQVRWPKSWRKAVKE